MRFFERASPKPADPFEALLQYLDGQAEEVDEARLAEMQYGWKSHQGRNSKTDPMQREDSFTIAVVLLLLVAVISMLLIALQRTA